MDVFICTNDKFREAETTPSTVSMDSMARSLISKSESYYLDLFLFCFYYGGMAPIDTA